MHQYASFEEHRYVDGYGWIRIYIVFDGNRVSFHWKSLDGKELPSPTMVQMCSIVATIYEVAGRRS